MPRMVSRRIALLACVLLLAPAAFAKPPEVDGFDKIGALARRLAALLERFAAEEEFARKPRVERMILTYAAGEPRFEGAKLSASSVARQTLRWDELRTDEPTAEAIRIAGALAGALGERIAAVRPTDKQERYDVSRPLVDSLDSRYLGVRLAAIRCLKALYKSDLFYDARGPASGRAKSKRAWVREIHKRRK